jgi:hypothetical protein
MALTGNEHVSVAVTREQAKAVPISGVWEGPVAPSTAWKYPFRSQSCDLSRVRRRGQTH